MVIGFNAFQAFSLQGQTSVVTGGGNGIGKAAALGLARSGAHVVIMDIELLAAQFAANEIVKGGASARAMKNSFGHFKSNFNSRLTHVQLY